MRKKRCLEEVRDLGLTRIANHPIVVADVVADVVAVVGNEC